MRPARRPSVPETNSEIHRTRAAARSKVHYSPAIPEHSSFETGHLIPGTYGHYGHQDPSNMSLEQSSIESGLAANMNPERASLEASHRPQQSSQRCSQNSSNWATQPSQNAQMQTSWNWTSQAQSQPQLAPNPTRPAPKPTLQGDADLLSWLLPEQTSEQNTNIHLQNSTTIAPSLNTMHNQQWEPSPSWPSSGHNYDSSLEYRPEYQGYGHENASLSTSPAASPSPSPLSSPTTAYSPERTTHRHQEQDYNQEVPELNYRSYDDYQSDEYQQHGGAYEPYQSGNHGHGCGSGNYEEYASEYEFSFDARPLTDESLSYHEQSEHPTPPAHAVPTPSIRPQPTIPQFRPLTPLPTQLPPNLPSSRGPLNSLYTPTNYSSFSHPQPSSPPPRQGPPISSHNYSYNTPNIATAPTTSGPPQNPILTSRPRSRRSTVSGEKPRDGPVPATTPPPQAERPHVSAILKRPSLLFMSPDQSMCKPERQLTLFRATSSSTCAKETASKQQQRSRQNGYVWVSS